ncbi:clathrin light chain 1 [Phtheirospermum japonicum]|uniref:Clathrin light chain n=1 Tax=Phtheirospermum japonicum TaxID=374723 RepID=A0A830AWV9_9LAMI|nr:clathrin light chain 1 [Phtheirospermum japonicum]
MQSPEVYGYGGSPLPFDAAGGGRDEYAKPFDAAADSEGLFTEASGGGPLLPDPGEMREEGTAFREWRRKNAVYLEEKEKKEKELRNQIIAEAEEYKRKFYEKSTQNCETNKAQNREREKLYHAQQEKFHKEAGQHFWKAVAEIIPREVPNFEKRRAGRKEDDKKPSVLVVQGPKPGKPTDMTRMRQILSKLKTNPPPHMIPPPPKKDTKDGKDSKEGKDAKNGKSEATPEESKDDKNNGAAGGKPVSPAKDAAAATPETAKPDEPAATEGKEKEEKETPAVA